MRTSPFTPCPRVCPVFRLEMNMLRLEQVVLMVLALLPALVIADENGMDMSMDGAMLVFVYLSLTRL